VTTTDRVRWGLGDFLWVWPTVIVGQVMGLSLVVGLRGADLDAPIDAWDVAAATFAAGAITVGALVFLARVRGLGSLRRDFGLVVRLRDWPWLAAGVLLQVGAGMLVWVIEWAGGTLPKQDVARALEQSPAVAQVLGVVAVVVVAPVAEELLFRGLLLRSLLRRFDAPLAVTGSAFVFAAVHLLDSSAAPLLAPLALVGLVSGIRAVRTGELSQSILLHAGFNLLSAVFLVGGRGW
jgi:membrane protease YdiL (CAAX protease family)